MADEVLASQIAYYRAHAPEYDDWWFCRGRHDFGPERRESWVAQIDVLRDALIASAPLGDVLEFAGGTGNWTRELASLAESVTVVDASPEAVDIARTKVSGNVSWRLTDIFEFRPERTYDVVFFSFWLSHVPVERFSAFWELVDTCVRPGGRVILMDNAHPDRSARVAPQFFGSAWSTEGSTVRGIDSETDVDTGIARRRAADGKSYELIKIWWEPDQLRERLAELGWDVHVSATGWAFIFGTGSRSAP
jgi:SAM-dependent methyltransferase